MEDSDESETQEVAEKEQLRKQLHEEQHMYRVISQMLKGAEAGLGEHKLGLVDITTELDDLRHRHCETRRQLADAERQFAKHKKALVDWGSASEDAPQHIAELTVELDATKHKLLAAEHQREELKDL